MLNKLKSIATNVRQELKVWQLVMKDRRTPILAKIFLGVAVAYLLMPFDLIPDAIPVIGQLDDIVIVGGLAIIALWLIPKQIVDDCRFKVQNGNS